MSWFTDIAGKAENFLNKVDQGAAQALHADQIKKSLYAASNNLISTQKQEPTLTVQNVSVEPKRKSSLLPELDQTSPTRSTKTVSKPLKTKQKGNNKEDDEKLLAFLNSETKSSDVKKTDKSESSHKKGSILKSKSDDTLKITQDNQVSIKGNSDAKLFEERNTEAMEKDDASVIVENDAKDFFVIDDQKSFENVTVDGGNCEMKSAKNIEEINNSSALELENKLLKKEMVSLNEEVASALKRLKKSDEDLKQLHGKYQTQGAHIKNMENVLRDLQGKESDLLETMGAKDSQIAVLRIRIEEADQDIKSKQKLLDTLKFDNERLLKDHSDSSGMHSQALDSLKLKLSEAESALRLEKESLKSVTNEAYDRIGTLEDEQQNIASVINATEKQLNEEKIKSKELAKNYEVAKNSHSQVLAELNDYKIKAQRILQTKDKVIAALKEANGDSDTNSHISSTVEFEELKHERDILKEELNQSILKINNLQSEMFDIESSLQSEVDTLQKQVHSHEESISQSDLLKKDLDQENLQLKSELRLLKDDLSSIKASMQSRIRDRDLEIEKLRKQITTRSISSSSEVELEARVHSLTESLIQKQTILEAMSTEKTSLSLQLERLENEVRDNRAYPRHNHSVIGINEADEVKARIPIFLRESPFDGQITRKVKRVYNSIDIFSVRIGVFLRQYPIARVFILLYMLLLHLWVIIVLMTYTPEIHTHDDSPHPGPSN